MSGSSSYASECLPNPKILLVGDYGVGKTCLMTRFALDSFDEDERYRYNIDVGFRKATLRLDGKDIKVQVWDIPGPCRFRGITSSYARNCCGVIIVYDVTYQESFNSLDHWLEQINKVMGEDSVDLLIIGNKCDLTTQRVVDYATAKEFAEKHGIPLVEASAKTSINVNQAFVKLIHAIMKRMPEQLFWYKNTNIKLTRRSPAQRIRDCC